MSTVTNADLTRNQSLTNYDVSKLQLGENEHVSINYTDSGAGSTLDSGLLMGKVAATGLLTEFDPTAADGSQNLVGVLFLGISEDIDVAAGATVALTLINKGRVAEGKLTLPDGVTLDDLITQDPMDRTVRDYMNAMGIILEDGEELTNFDNQ